MKNTPKDTIDVLIPPKDELDSEEVNSIPLQNEEDWEKKEYEKRNDPEHPYCTNWPVSKKEKKERSREIIFAGRFINKNNIFNLIKAFIKLNILFLLINLPANIISLLLSFFSFLLTGQLVQYGCSGSFRFSYSFFSQSSSF